MKKKRYKLITKKIVNPRANIYCHGTKFGSFIYLTTNGPKDQIIPAINTTGIAIFSFFSSIIIRYLLLNILYYNKNEIYLKILIFEPIGE